MIKNNGDVGYEYLNAEQLEYLFRCRHKERGGVNPLVVQSSENEVTLDGERAVSHFFLTKQDKKRP
jgi:hypothetical protein